MLENSIHQFYTEAQIQDIENEVIYCPMCEATHENNTFCQCPGWGN